MRTKGGWVINYSCCMTVCDYVCVQKHSLLGNTSQVLSDRKQCVCRERLHWELCAVSACTMQKKCLSHFEVRRAPQWQDTLLLGRTFFWLWVLSWCFTVCTDGSPTGMLRLASLHSPTATLTFLFLSWDHRNIIWVQLQRFIYPFNIIFSQLLHKLWSFNACSCL